MTALTCPSWCPHDGVAHTHLSPRFAVTYEIGLADGSRKTITKVTDADELSALAARLAARPNGGRITQIRPHLEGWIDRCRRAAVTGERYWAAGARNV